MWLLRLVLTTDTFVSRHDFAIALLIGPTSLGWPTAREQRHGYIWQAEPPATITT
ncbi:hypothetical protein HNR73_005611 [Phytomonospora endophytica]|uniref:Uncharacterized protein n=1 Tax=Phytomonospora endophytica TaxID=714109 RepID=A0A841FSE6_9ACTN|nr:hypothetical protein [Phytomonospora endophytica]